MNLTTSRTKVKRFEFWPNRMLRKKNLQHLVRVRLVLAFLIIAIAKQIFMKGVRWTVNIIGSAMIDRSTYSDDERELVSEMIGKHFFALFLTKFNYLRLTLLVHNTIHRLLHISKDRAMSPFCYRFFLFQRQQLRRRQ